jgi:hypothetical protein
LNLSEDEIRELNYKIFEENHPPIQKRLLSVYLKEFFCVGNEFLAKVLYVHCNSINTWIRSVKEFAHKIEEQTEIKRGLTQVRKFIRKIGFKYLQTGHFSNGHFGIIIFLQQKGKDTTLMIIGELVLIGIHALFFCP